MVAEYDSRLKGIDTNSSAGSQGQGILMATEIGADVENMEIMRIRPTLPLNIENHIAVSQDGKRFMNEYNSEDTIFVDGHDLHIKAIENREEKHYWVIIDEDAYNEYGDKLTKYMAAESNYSKGETLEELASMIDIDEETLEATVSEWNQMVIDGEDKQFVEIRVWKKQ